MVSKIGKGILYLNVFAVLFVGILDDIHIDVILIYGTLLLLEQLLVPLLIFDRNRKRLGNCKAVLCAMAVWLAYMLGTALCRRIAGGAVEAAAYSFCAPVALFLGSVVFWDKQDVKRTYGLLKIWYVLNLVLSILEFWLFDKRDDMLGGFIGCRMGSNQYMNLIHCAMLIAGLAESFCEDRLKPYTIFVIFASMILASLQELKLFYYEYLLIFAGAAFIYGMQKRVSLKTLGQTLLLMAAAVGIGLTIMYFVYPEHFAVLVGTKSYAKYEETSRSPYAISRAHFISEINELWFHGDLMKNLFGIGFGGGHYGTAFYEANEPMHYLYFAHQTLFLEGGLIGLGLFILIFMVSAVQCGLDFLRNRPMSVVKTFGTLFSMIMALNVLYNDAVMDQTAMLIWPIMAVPFIGKKYGEQ